MEKVGGVMIGNDGKVDGNIKLMHLKTGNGRKIEQNYLRKMAMDGGGLSQQEKICDLC